MSSFKERKISQMNTVQYNYIHTHTCTRIRSYIHLD